jgi:hypothetical protein
VRYLLAREGPAISSAVRVSLAQKISLIIGRTRGNGLPTRVSSARYSSIWRVMVVMVACGFTNHVSPMRAARRMALSLLAATQMGGCGCWTGRHVRVTFESVHTSLSTVTLSSVHSRFTTSRHCSKRRTRCPRGTLKASNSTSR